MWSGMVDGLAVYQFYESAYLWHEEYRNKVKAALGTIGLGLDSSQNQLPDHICNTLNYLSLELAKEANKQQSLELIDDIASLSRVNYTDIQDQIFCYREHHYLFFEQSKCIGLNQGIGYLPGKRALQGEGVLLKQDNLENTLAIIDKAEFTFFIELGCSVIIFSNKLSDSESKSKSNKVVSPLFGTLYLNWTDSPLKNAETLLSLAAKMYIMYLLFGLSLSQETWAYNIFSSAVLYHFYDRIVNGQGFSLISPTDLAYCNQQKEKIYLYLKEAENRTTTLKTDVNNKTLSMIIDIYLPYHNRFYIYRKG